MAANETEMEVEAVKCCCCGLKEECTPSYIDRVRESYHGRWICGLCAEAVKDEALKSKNINTDEALKHHMKFRSSSSSPPNKPTLDLILAMKQLLFRSLDSPRKQPFTFSPLRTCFPTEPETQQPDTRILQGAGDTS